MHQNAVLRICNFKIFPGMTPPDPRCGRATPSRTHPQHGAGLRRRCCDPHVTPVLGGMTKYRKGPQRTAKDHKGPTKNRKGALHRTTEDRQS